MKKKLMVGLIAAVILVAAVFAPSAEERSEPTKYEYAVVKWDGTDRLYMYLPTKFQLMHVKDQGVGIPRDAQEEEWCLAFAANQLAKEGWEPVTLDSRRILLRRVKR